MKNKLIKAVSFLLVFVIAVPFFSACSDNRGETVMSYGDVSINENIYFYELALMKSELLKNYTGSVTDNPLIWEQVIGENVTFDEYSYLECQVNIKTRLFFADYALKHDADLTSEEKAEVQKQMDTIVDSFGTKEALNKYLETYLMDYKLLKEYYEKKRREKENPEADNTEEKYLAPEDVEKIRIPRNMYIWATMNSADQGVYPMDTAFKRRWNFEYTGIDDGEGNVGGEFANDWKALRKHVNALLQKAGINEDKQMGPFFLKSSELQDFDSFVAAVKNKVLMYLFEDAAKHKRTEIFKGDVKDMRYSVICKKFEDAYICKKGEDKGVKMSTALDSIFQPKV